MKDDVKEAKAALDKVIKKARVHFYKPIQVAEVLYKYRTTDTVNLNDVESYRTKSKHWRDEITIELLGRKCNSSAKYQDDVFNDDAVPPKHIKILAEENKRLGGAIEAYIYSRFQNKHTQLSAALALANSATKETFNLKTFIDSFWSQPGLKRSIDKIYEIIVYSLFSTLVEALELQVAISVNADKINILSEFSNFAKSIMCLDVANTKATQDAKVYRVGVTNAADRGLDMYSNWGPAIQIKHLALSEELAENIVTSIASDRIVIVCKSAEKNIILSLLTQIGWRSRIQSIVTENDLIEWYEKALRGIYAAELGDRLLDSIREELAAEFPAIDDIPDIIKNRNYEKKTNPEWS